MEQISTESTIPVYLNKDFFKYALETCLRGENVEILQLQLKKPNSGGENYCSNIYHTQIRYKCGSRIEDISMIIKSLPEQKQGALRKLNIFNKETVFYLDIKPKIESLMWHAKTFWELGARHIFSTTQPEQTIILEDLTQHGFTLKSRQIGLDKADAIVVIKKLAQYHALTMTMAVKDPKTIVDKFEYGLLNKNSIHTPAFKALFGAQLLKIATISADWPGFEDITTKLLRYHENFSDMIMKSVYPMEGSLNVLNHGDLWVNNLLFRNDEVRFIDFQLCFYGSVGFDLNYFFNTSLQLDVLQHHKEALLQIYFEVLVEALKRLPGYITLPTFDTIKEELKAREGYGFFVAFGLLPLMAMDSMDSYDNNLENFHDTDFSGKKIELMFKENGRALNTLKFIIKELDIFKK